MIQTIIMFVFGNAVWDWLVEFFGSTEDVVKVALLTVAAFLCFKLLIRHFVWSLVVISLIVIALSR